MFIIHDDSGLVAMQRRKVLKSVAAGGALTIGVSGSANAVQVDVEDIEGLKLVRGGEVVKDVENPTDEQFRELDSMDGGVVRYVEEDCSTYCRTDCDAVCDGTCYYTHDCTDTKWCC